LNNLGLLIGLPGIISTVFPAVNELAYAFGLGIIVWWIWLGIVLLRKNSGAVPQTSGAFVPTH